MGISVGERIRERRKLLNLTQKELGAKLLLSEFNISKYERNYSNPDIDTLKKLSDALECSVDYLVGKTDNPNVQVIEYVDKELGPIEIGMNNYPYQLTPAEVEEMIQTLKKYHFNVEALIEDMRNKEKENTDN